MDYDPLSEIVDEPLTVDDVVIQQLTAFRDQPHLTHLPGVNPTPEREHLTKVLVGLVDTLLSGVYSNPSKLWVMTQFQHYLVSVEEEDTEGREHFGMEVEEIMDILGIESSDGLLSFYLGGL